MRRGTISRSSRPFLRDLHAPTSERAGLPLPAWQRTFPIPANLFQLRVPLVTSFGKPLSRSCQWRRKEISKPKTIGIFLFDHARSGPTDCP